MVPTVSVTATGVRPDTAVCAAAQTVEERHGRHER
ncbi:hypothetical protein PF005_g31611, partial [Phytophthora fragariae]